MDWNEGMKEGKHKWRQVFYPMGLASDHQRRDWTQVGKAGSQPISPIKQASEFAVVSVFPCLTWYELTVSSDIIS